MSEETKDTKAPIVPEAKKQEPKPATAKKPSKVGVKFLRPWNRYYPSDMAGFDAKTAKMLIDEKIAEPVGK